MIREQEARRVRGLCGKAETARHQLCLDLDPGECRDQRATLQAFFQSPGCVVGISGHHDEKKRRIEA